MNHESFINGTKVKIVVQKKEDQHLTLNGSRMQFEMSITITG